MQNEGGQGRPQEILQVGVGGGGVYKGISTDWRTSLYRPHASHGSL